jgi:hypothetical protein
MKREFFKYAVFAMIVMFSLSACEKETTNSASVIGKATISGTVIVRYDATKTGSDSTVFAQAGTKMYAKYSSKDLVTVAGSSTYADIIKETTIDGSGNYSFTVDANLLEVTVTIYSDDYRHTYYDGANNVSKVFSLPSTKVKVTKDVIRIKDLQLAIK